MECIIILWVDFIVQKYCRIGICTLLLGNPNFKASYLLLQETAGGHELARVGRPVTEYIIVV